MKEKGSKFLNFNEIEAKDRTQIVSIPSGFTQLDKMIIGFNKGEVSLWSGKNGAAKSTIINQIAINAVDKDFKGVIFSGELPSHKMKNWVQILVKVAIYALGLISGIGASASNIF